MPTCDAYFVRCKSEENVFANMYRIFEGMGLQFASVLRPQNDSTNEYQSLIVPGLKGSPYL